MEQVDHIFKLIIIGDSGVGKSCLLIRFADDKFTDSFISTIGVDFRFRTIRMDGRTVKLQIWDTAGQERFRTITAAYYRGCDGILLVFDVTKRDSFESLDGWIEDIKRYTGGSAPVPLLLIGNKADITDRDVDQNDIDRYSKQHRIEYIETSALNSTNVETAFLSLTKELIRRTRSDVSSDNHGSEKKYDLLTKPKKNGCC